MIANSARLGQLVGWAEGRPLFNSVPCLEESSSSSLSAATTWEHAAVAQLAGFADNRPVYITGRCLGRVGDATVGRLAGWADGHSVYETACCGLEFGSRSLASSSLSSLSDGSSDSGSSESLESSQSSSLSGASSDSGSSASSGSGSGSSRSRNPSSSYSASAIAKPCCDATFTTLPSVLYLTLVVDTPENCSCANGFSFPLLYDADLIIISGPQNITGVWHGSDAMCENGVEAWFWCENAELDPMKPPQYFWRLRVSFGITLTEGRGPLDGDCNTVIFEFPGFIFADSLPSSCQSVTIAGFVTR